MVKARRERESFDTLRRKWTEQPRGIFTSKKGVQFPWTPPPLLGSNSDTLTQTFLIITHSTYAIYDCLFFVTYVYIQIVEQNLWRGREKTGVSSKENLAFLSKNLPFFKNKTNKFAGRLVVVDD